MFGRKTLLIISLLREMPTVKCFLTKATEFYLYSLEKTMKSFRIKNQEVRIAFFVVRGAIKWCKLSEVEVNGTLVSFTSKETVASMFPSKGLV